MSCIAAHTQSIATAIFKMLTNTNIIFKKRLASSFQIHTSRRCLCCLPCYYLWMMTITKRTFLRTFFLYQLQQFICRRNSISTYYSYHNLNDYMTNNTKSYTYIVCKFHNHFTAPNTFFVFIFTPSALR